MQERKTRGRKRGREICVCVLILFEYVCVSTGERDVHAHTLQLIRQGT